MTASPHAPAGKLAAELPAPDVVEVSFDRPARPKANGAAKATARPRPVASEPEKPPARMVDGPTAPVSLEAERSVLGSVLIDPDALPKVAGSLHPDDFWSRAHGQIYQAALMLRAAATPIDLVTLGDELQHREQLASIGGPAYLAGLMNEVPTAVHVEHYAQIVASKALARRMIEAAGRLAAAGYENPNDPDAALAALEQITAAVRGSWPAPELEGPEAITARLGARLLGSIGTDPPSPLLIERLDPTGHTILYGTGGVGKGTLASDWIVSLRTQGLRILIVDYENHPDEWARRIYGLGGAQLMDGILIVNPLTASWGGRRGPIWEQAPELRALALAFAADVAVIDSIVMGCGGVDPLKPEAAALYAGGLEYIGLPALSLAHVSKDLSLAMPFGSVFWHNLARMTWSLERRAETALLVNHKHNNYPRAPKLEVTITFDDGRPVEIWERPYAQVLAARIDVALGDGPLTLGQLVDALNEDLDEDDEPLKPDSVSKALRRGQKSKPAKFATDGATWRRVDAAP